MHSEADKYEADDGGFPGGKNVVHEGPFYSTISDFLIVMSLAPGFPAPCPYPRQCKHLAMGLVAC